MSLLRNGRGGGVGNQVGVRVLGMANSYRPVDRDQAFLLPPKMADWLPEGHLAWRRGAGSERGSGDGQSAGGGG